MKIKIAYFFLIISCVSCVSTHTYISNGQYGAAVEQAARKIARDRKNEKEIFALEIAFQKANERDMETINYLKKEGTPDNWEEIFNVYSAMRSRQELVKPLLPITIPSTGRNANLNIVNYDDEIIHAKQKAAEYFYARAGSLLEKNDRYEARKAYADLQHVKRFYANYKDSEELLKRARYLGASFVNFSIQNKTGFSIPSLFEEELKKISLSELDRDWIVYHTSVNEKIKYHYTILVNMKIIDVSPDAVRDVQFTESREVPDGFKYVLDARGNVKKDSLGNDIKIPKTKIISCNVIERIQNKKAIIAGSLDYMDNATGQLIKTDPITAEHFFEYHSAQAMGDINALKPETKAKLANPPAPFPSGGDMVLAAGQTLKAMVKEIIWRNKSLVF